MNRPVRSPGRVVLVTSCLGGGGAERIVATMAAHWTAAGREVHVVTLRSDEAGPAYDFPSAVRVHALGLIRERNRVADLGHLRRLRELRRRLLALQPAVVVSFIDKLNAAVLLALAGTGIPVVATEHHVPWLNPLGRPWEWLRRRLYRRAWAVVCPTRPLRDWFAGRMPGNFVLLRYPAHLSPMAPPEAVSRRGRRILAAGRLVPVKGFDLLIDAFAAVADEPPGWHLEILGEGPERAGLERQVAARGLAGCVSLPGHVPDVGRRLQEADIFALPSRQEVYPMILCEAMAAGTAVLAADCPAGPGELMTDGADGLLVPPENAGALAGALRRLMADPALRHRLGAAARARALSFTPLHVMGGWDNLLAEAAGPRP